MKAISVAVILNVLVTGLYAAGGGDAPALPEVPSPILRAADLHLAQSMSEWQLSPDDTSFKLRAAEDGRADGFYHLRFTQHHRGVRVVGAEVIVHVASDESRVWSSESVQKDLRVVTEPNVSPQMAFTVAKRAIGLDRATFESAVVETELIIFPRSLGVSSFDRLVWRLRLRMPDDRQERLQSDAFVDAVTGEFVLEAPAEYSATAAGASVDVS